MASRIERPTVLLALLILVLVGAIALLTLLTTDQPTDEVMTNRSVYNNGPSGYRAWYLANRKTGLPMTPWQKSFPELSTLPRPATMLMVQPYTVSGNQVLFGEKEVEALLDWVSAGNTLVLIDDFKRFGSAQLLKLLSLKLSQAPGKPDTPVVFRLPEDDEGLLGRYVSQPLVGQSRLRLSATPATDVPVDILMTDSRGEPVLIRLPHGRGSLILGTPVDLADNAYLHQPPNDNYQLLSNLLVQARQPVFINEYVHGYGDVGNIFAYYQQETPLGLIFTQLLFGFLFVLWLSFLPWKPRLPACGTADAQPAGGSQRFIQAVGGLYARNRAGTIPLQAQLRQVESTLFRRYRVSLEETSRVQDLLAHLAGEYSSREESPAALLAALQKARELIRQKEPVSSRELLRLSRQLTVLQERLHHGSRPGSQP